MCRNKERLNTETRYVQSGTGNDGPNALKVTPKVGLFNGHLTALAVIDSEKQKTSC